MVRDIYVIGPNDDLLDHWIQNNASTITVSRNLICIDHRRLHHFHPWLSYPIVQYSNRIYLPHMEAIWKQAVENTPLSLPP